MGLFAGILNVNNNVGSRGAHHPAVSDNPMVRNNPLVPPNTPATNPPVETLTTPIQQFTDELQTVQAPVAPNIGSTVRTFAQTVTEDAHTFTQYETRQVTAFIDQFVPIPWFHGDQKVTK